MFYKQKCISVCFFISLLCIEMSELADCAGKNKCWWKRTAGNKLNIALDTRLCPIHFECLQHWLNDLRVDNSLKSKQEKISRTNDDSNPGAEVGSINFIWKFCLEILSLRQSRRAIWPMRFFSSTSMWKTFRLSWKWEQFYK